MTAPEVDLAGLSLRDALDLAILIEEEAEERYGELAHQLEAHDTPEAAAFFRTMAGNEARHRQELAVRRVTRFGTEPRTVSRALLWDVEAPEYDEARAFMTLRQAMETALRCEEKAHAFFLAALPRITDPEVHRLFEELCDEEVRHQALVRERLVSLAPDEPVDAEDFTDEPVSQ
jgi:rubrerythrin